MLFKNKRDRKILNVDPKVIAISTITFLQCMSVPLSMFVSMLIPRCMSDRLFVFRSFVRSFVRSPVWLPIRPSLCLYVSVCLSVCLCVCLFFDCLFIHLSFPPQALTPGDNSARIPIETAKYTQVVIYDHITRRKT